MGDRSRVYTILVFNQSHPVILSLAIPLWVGTMSTGGVLGYRWGRNGEFCVTMVLCQDCWHSWLKALVGLIGFTLAGLKA